MGIFDSLKQRLRQPAKSQPALTGQDDWREAFALTISALVLEKPSIAELLERLPPETAKELSNRLNILEARIFDLWRVSHALRRSMKHIPQAELFTLLDAGHLNVYWYLLQAGMTESEIMDMQRLLPQRYTEYDDAYSGFWAKDDKWMFRFSRVVTSYIFQRESTDARVAATLAAIVNSGVVSIAQVFGDYKPPSR
jgi:hypothetical protein